MLDRVLRSPPETAIIPHSCADFRFVTHSISIVSGRFPDENLENPVGNVSTCPTGFSSTGFAHGLPAQPERGGVPRCARRLARVPVSRPAQSQVRSPCYSCELSPAATKMVEGTRWVGTGRARAGGDTVGRVTSTARSLAPALATDAPTDTFT